MTRREDQEAEDGSQISGTRGEDAKYWRCEDWTIKMEAASITCIRQFPGASSLRSQGVSHGKIEHSAATPTKPRAVAFPRISVSLLSLLSHEP